MAIVPRETTPSVMPQGGPLGVTPVPAAFGGGLGEALGNLGKEGQAASDMLAQHANVVATMDAKAASDGAAVGWSNQVGQLDNHYRDANSGNISAVNNLPQFYSGVEDARKDARSGLTSPLAQQMFDENTRLQTSKLQIGMAAWASDQRKTYNVNQFKSAADQATRGATLDTLDDVVKTQIVPQFHAIGLEMHWSDAQFQDELSKYVGGAAYGLIQGTAAKHPDVAQTALTKYGDYMDPQQRGVLQNQIQTSVDNHSMATVADEAYAASAAHGASAGVGNARDYYVSQGWDRGSAAAITGQLQAESGLRSVPGDGGKAFGLAQWHGPRQADFEAWAGKPITQATPDEQLAFVNYELTQGKYKSVGDQLRNAQTLEEKSDILTKFYESPADQGPQQLANRRGLAQAAMGVPTNSHTDTLDNIEQNAPTTLAAIAADPRLRGDPILVNGAQRQYLTNVNQARSTDNLATQAAMDRLTLLAEQNGVTDITKLGALSPTANADIAALSTRQRDTLSKALTYEGNIPNTERTANFQTLYGGIVNGDRNAVYANLNNMELTISDRKRLGEMQQQAIAKAAKISQISANVTSALQLEPVKQALAARPDLKADSPGYNQFTGQLSEKLQEWIDEHPGKKPSESDKAGIVSSLLAAKPGHQYVAGVRLWPTDIPQGGVPDDVAANIRSQVEPSIGRKLSDFEVGQLYARGQASAR